MQVRFICNRDLCLVKIFAILDENSYVSFVRSLNAKLKNVTVLFKSSPSTTYRVPWLCILQEDKFISLRDEVSFRRKNKCMQQIGLRDISLRLRTLRLLNTIEIQIIDLTL